MENITLTENKLRFIIALAKNPTLRDYDIAKSENNLYINYYINDKHEDLKPAEIVKLTIAKD